MPRQTTEPSTNHGASTGWVMILAVVPFSVEGLLVSAARASCPVRGWEGEGEDAQASEKGQLGRLALQLHPA